ncbi:hypothetical protein BDZ45DRAFT_755135 [Acephala macrosclerotiorum]|nr:hypothetical protein BDZ45DRAFT_755135 [Acephala macrosclerotiorum]
METPKTTILEFDDVVLIDYLEKKYQITISSVGGIMPYLDIWCDRLPPPSERPFMFSGLVTIWLSPGEDGYYGVDLGVRICLFPTMSKTLSTILTQNFPDALAISFISHTIVVEFEKAIYDQYGKTLDGKPHIIPWTDIGLRYHNGLYREQDFTQLRFLNLGGFSTDCLHSDNLRIMDELFWIDNTATEAQLVVCCSRRVSRTGNRDNETLVQDLYAAAAPEKNRKLKIRKGEAIRVRRKIMTRSSVERHRIEGSGEAET